MYDAIAAGDLQSFTAVLDPKVVWTVPGSHHLAGTFSGIPALLTHLSEVAQRTGGQVALDVVEMLAGDHHIAAVVNVEMTVDGTTVDDRQIHLFELHGGRIVSVREYHGDEGSF